MDQVYLKAALPYGKTAETALVVPEGYTRRLKVIAANRVAVADEGIADTDDD